MSIGSESPSSKVQSCWLKVVSFFLVCFFELVVTCLVVAWPMFL